MSFGDYKNRKFPLFRLSHVAGEACSPVQIFLRKYSEEYTPYYFKLNALLVVSFYDGNKKLVSAKHFNRFDIDRQFANEEKKWMTSSVTLDLPPKAKFYRVELMGYQLKSELILLPDPDVR